MNKTILVLAASLYQVETIECAKRLGHRVVTLDNRPENPGHALADRSYKIDTTDMAAVLDVARLERIDGVIAPCTDVAVPTAAHVAHALHLPGIPFQSAQVVCDKILFRKFLGQHHFRVPTSLAVNATVELPDSLFQQGAWIIKPNRSSGSKGIFVVRSKSEFVKRLPVALSFSPDGSAILEKYIDGFQGTCEGILRNGDLALTFVLDRQTPDLPYVTTCGHHVPTSLSRAYQQNLHAILKEVWRLLGITDGPFDCDFVAAAGEVYLLEVAPRMGGNSISTLLRKAAGFDIARYSVRHVLGEDPDLPVSCSIRPAAVIILGVFEAGKLAFNTREAETLVREPWVDSLTMDNKPGDAVLPFINGRHRVGQAIVYGESRDDLEAKVLMLKRRLGLRAVSASPRENYE
jgi:biotin carboxylase